MSNSIEKSVNISILLDFYGVLLHERQREIITAYYNDDLSLSEIAENFGISRQGVRDSIKKSENALTLYENALGLHAKSEKDSFEIKKILDMIMTLDIEESSENVRDKIISLLKNLSN